MTEVRSLERARADVGLRGADAPRRPLSVVIGLEGLALGGCPINALDLGRALRERGHGVHVCAIDEDVRVSLIPYAEQSGFDVTVLPNTGGVAARARRIRRFAERHHADVVHVFAPWLASSAAAAELSRQRRLTVVTNWMMSNVTYTPRAMPLIVGTRQMQEEAQEFHGSRVWLMEPPVDIDREIAGADGAQAFRVQHGISKDEIAAVIVSRVDKHMKAEGIRHSIDAVRYLDDPRIRLIIVGDGDAFGDISRMAETTNRELQRPAVVLVGAMHDPRPAYAASDIMLGMGGSALRSLAHSKPLIVLGERGFSRILEPATLDYFLTSGFYGDDLEDRPSQHLSHGLLQLMDPARRRELGRFGNELVRSRFGLDVTADALERIYRMEIHGAPRSAHRIAASTFTLARAVGHEWVRSLRRSIGSLPRPQR